MLSLSCLLVADWLQTNQLNFNYSFSIKLKSQKLSLTKCIGRSSNSKFSSDVFVIYLLLNIFRLVVKLLQPIYFKIFEFLFSRLCRLKVTIKYYNDKNKLIINIIKYWVISVTLKFRN